MFKALQYGGAAIMGLMMSKGALEIAGALGSRGSLAYVLVLIASVPVIILAMIGMATAPSGNPFAAFGHREHRED